MLDATFIVLKVEEHHNITNPGSRNLTIDQTNIEFKVSFGFALIICMFRLLRVYYPKGFFETRMTKKVLNYKHW